VPSYHQQIQLSARSTGSGRKGRQASETAEDVDMDTEEGRDDGGDDDTLYCFCQEKSYGEMIGCDNDSCRFEWVSLVTRQ
jgi:chromatin modification-related protein YNG2